MPQLDVPPPPKGMDRALSSKMSAKYDLAVEGEIRNWIKELTGDEIESGSMNVERALKSGHVLVKLIKAILERLPNKPAECNKLKLKCNDSEIHFKQMENIEMFLRSAAALGLPETSLFPTADLFDGKNMPMVLACIYQLGTVCQLHEMNGPKCGPKPTEKHVVEFTPEQLRASEGIIGLQAGTNKFDSQKGMKMGATRHISDYKTAEMNKNSHASIGLQAGTNKFASQKGMKMGAVRHIADIRADDINKDSHAEIGLQAGTNKFASQKGMKMGAVRHIADIRADDMNKDSQSDIGLQAGTNKFASQKGMCMGAVRHVSDIQVADMVSDGQGIIGLQSGTNKFASQKGMSSMGAVRHVSDIRSDDMNKDSHGDIGLQAGTNKFASQKGMSSMGAMRHIADIRAEDVSREGSATIGLQMGSNRGASQKGMSFGSQRHVADLTVTPLSLQQGVAGVNKGMAPAGISYMSSGAAPMDQPSQQVVDNSQDYRQQPAAAPAPEPVAYNDVSNDYSNDVSNDVSNDDYNNSYSEPQQYNYGGEDEGADM